MKTPTYNSFQKVYYPDSRVYRDLQKLPIFKQMSKIVSRFLWHSTSREEYRTRTLIANGKIKTDFDFLYVMKGTMSFKLDQVKLDGIDC